MHVGVVSKRAGRVCVGQAPSRRARRPCPARTRAHPHPIQHLSRATLHALLHAHAHSALPQHRGTCACSLILSCTRTHTRIKRSQQSAQQLRTRPTWALSPHPTHAPLASSIFCYHPERGWERTAAATARAMHGTARAAPRVQHSRAPCLPACPLDTSVQPHRARYAPPASCLPAHLRVVGAVKVLAGEAALGAGHVTANDEVGAACRGGRRRKQVTGADEVVLWAAQPLHFHSKLMMGRACACSRQSYKSCHAHAHKARVRGCPPELPPCLPRRCGCVCVFVYMKCTLLACTVILQYLRIAGPRRRIACTVGPNNPFKLRGCGSSP